MAIQCNNINQTINELLIAFQDCKKIKNEDLIKTIELIAAVYNCENNSTNYNTTQYDIYESVTDIPIIYEPNSFHAISVIVILGTINYNNVIMPQGASINLEFTTLNQQEFTFLAKAGSKVLVEYIIETI